MANNSGITPDLLSSLLSADAQRRSQAEAFLQNLSLNDRIQGLVHIVITNDNDNAAAITHLAAVLLRRDILRMKESTPEALVDPLVQAFLNNENPSSTTRIAIGHCLAEICGSVAVLGPSQKDKERVMSHILSAIANPAGQGDIASLRLLAALAERAPLVFATTAVPSLESLIQQVVSAMNSNDNNKQERLEALMQLLIQAAIATTAQYVSILPLTAKPVDTIDTNSAAAVLGRSCLPLVMNSSGANNNLSLVILQEWIQAASQCPSFLAGDKAVLDLVLGSCLATANNKHMQGDSTTVLTALQVVSSICAVGDVKRKILGTDPALCQRLMMGDTNTMQQGVVALLTHWLTVGIDEDAEAWASEPASLLEEDPWDGDDTFHFAETLLHSFLHSVPAQTLSVALPLVEQKLQPTSGDWRQLCAGLAMLEACVALCPISFSSHIPVATNAAVNMATGTQPIRVQYQALRLLGILCEADNPNTAEMVRQTYAVQVLQTLAQAVQSPCTKASSLACLAIVSFTRRESQEEADNPVVPFLADLLRALHVPLSHASLDRGSTVVKIRAVGAVAALAQASGEAFIPFYATVMPCLFSCSQVDANYHEAYQLVGAAVEACTIVGQAIASAETTRAQYVRSAVELMQFMVPILQNGDNVASDVPLDRLLSACARISSVMGADFFPYLQAVVPPLLQRAVAPPDVSVTEGDEAAKRQQLELDEDGTESITVVVPGKGVKKFTINTTQMETKAQAARAIYELAVALGAHFHSYVQPCLEAFCPLVNFQYSSEVRATSALAVAKVFAAGCLYADDSADAGKLVQCFPTLVKALTKQIEGEGTDDMDALYALADALSEVLYCVYERKDAHFQASGYSLADASQVVRTVMEAISSCLKRRSRIYALLSGQNGSLTGEDEKEECHAQLRQEELLLTPLVDSVGYNLKLFKKAFVPVFDNLVAPILLPCLTNGDIRAKLAAVCLWDDVVEHCGAEAAAKHSGNLIYGILLGIDEQTNGNDIELQSASIYGISQIARHAPSSVLTPHLATIFQQLLKVVKASTKEESEHPMMDENAVSALASMTLIGTASFAGSAPVSQDEMLKMFVEHLPLREDPDEAKICHEGFCELLETGKLDVATTNIAEVLRVLGETLAYAEDEDIATQETVQRMAQALARLFQSIPVAITTQAVAALSQDAQNGISMAMGY